MDKAVYCFNVHAGTLSPELFEKYVLPEYKMRCERLHKAGKFISAHFDGDNASLMKYYQETGLDGIEAITPFIHRRYRTYSFGWENCR